MQSENTHHNINHQDDEVNSEDLAIVSRWARKKLFNTAQFIYNPQTDLKINGPLYDIFCDDCGPQLVGLKLLKGQSQDVRYQYVESLWAEATKKRTNRITDGLNARRSSIYSAMQNRFIGKSEIQ